MPPSPPILAEFDDNLVKVVVGVIIAIVIIVLVGLQSGASPARNL